MKALDSLTKRFNMHSIKVFTSGNGPVEAGQNLTDQFETWKRNNFGPSRGELYIASNTSSSSENGWMITIAYKRVFQ